jgi:hypothetical protein
MFERFGVIYKNPRVFLLRGGDVTSALLTPTSFSHYFTYLLIFTLTLYNVVVYYKKNILNLCRYVYDYLIVCLIIILLIVYYSSID